MMYIFFIFFLNFFITTSYAVSNDSIANFKSTCVCKGCNLNHANLANYRPAEYTKGDGCLKQFACDLRYAKLAYANLSHSDFSLRDTCVSEANFSYANLYHANLTQAKLRGVYMHGIRLQHADLSRSDLTLVEAESANFSFSNLSSAKAYEQTMGGLGANFRHANFSYANLSSAELTGDFTGVDFSHANLEHATLTLIGTQYSLSDKRTKEINFSYADLKDASINDLDKILVAAIYCHTTMPDGKINNQDCPHKKM